MTEPLGATRRAESPVGQETKDRSALMHRHVAARARRDTAPLGSDEFRAAAEEIARIEIAIAQLEEPAPRR